MTTGERLVLLSGLSSGSALEHLAAISETGGPGSGVIVSDGLLLELAPMLIDLTLSDAPVEAALEDAPLVAELDDNPIEIEVLE